MGRVDIDITAPQPISQSHTLDEFDCGNESLNEWLVKRALKNDLIGASRTFVVCYQQDKVAGYYSLATGSILNKKAPGNIRRGMPDPIPILVLGRLAVNNNHQGLGIGRGLLKDAILRTIVASQNVGIRGILVHAISDNAKAFYVKNGFLPCPNDDMTLILNINSARRRV